MDAAANCPMGHPYPGGKRPPLGCSVCAEIEEAEFGIWHANKMREMDAEHAAIRERAPDALRINVMATGQTRVITVPKRLRGRR